MAQPPHRGFAMILTIMLLVRMVDYSHMFQGSLNFFKYSYRVLLLETRIQVRDSLKSFLQVH